MYYKGFLFHVAEEESEYAVPEGVGDTRGLFDGGEEGKQDDVGLLEDDGDGGAIQVPPGDDGGGRKTRTETMAEENEEYEDAESD